MYSNNKVGVVICRKDDPELKKLRPFPLCSIWAQRIHPAYSLENMEVNPELIFIVDTRNIPQFFNHILGHPDLIDLQTQEQKRRLGRSCIMKAVGKSGGRSGIMKAVGKNTNSNGITMGVGKNTNSNTNSSGN